MLAKYPERALNIVGNSVVVQRLIRRTEEEREHRLVPWTKWNVCVVFAAAIVVDVLLCLGVVLFVMVLIAWIFIIRNLSTIMFLLLLRRL